MAEQAPVEKNQFNPPKWILKTMSRTHIFLNRLTLGKMFNTLSGDEVCFVTMTGAKSGRSITIPLMYVPYKNGLIIRCGTTTLPKTLISQSGIADKR
jgi:hypothetical protein